MKRRTFVAPLTAVMLTAMMVPALAGSKVGDSAPPMNPQGYLNAKGPIAWDDLQGKVILIEKWATW